MMIGKAIQKNIPFLNSREWMILQYLIVIIFFICKCFHLFHTPYYDEAWVYYPAVKCMSVEGLKAIFSGECISFTRGHPLFFHFLAWMWAKVFGISILSMHSFALTISIGFLLYIRHTLSDLFEPRSVLVILILLCLQSIFIIQSCMLLPEVTLCFLLYASLYNFHLGRLKSFVLFFVLACMTKEIAIIYLPALFLVGVFKKRSEFFNFDVLLSFAIIVFVWLGYLGLQKQLHGWYFYPDHTDTINFNIDSIAKNWNYMLHFLIGFQGRRYIVICLVISLLAQRNKLSVYIFSSIGALCILIWNFNSIHSLFFLVSTFVFYIVLFFLIKKVNSNFEFLNLLMGIIFISSFFFSLGFFTMRYLLPAIFSFLIVSVVLANETATLPGYFRLPILIALLVCSYLELHNNKKMGDTDMGSIQAMHAQHDLYQYLDSTIVKKANVCTNSFLIWCELGGKYDFYTPPPIDSHFLGYNTKCNLFIYSNIEGENINPFDTLHLMSTKKIEHGDALIIVSKRN